MNKDEIKDMIKTMITEALNSCKEVKEEVTNEAPPTSKQEDVTITESPTETVIIQETKTEEKETTVQDFKKDEEVKNEEPKTEEVKDEVEEEKEVIKKESLNSSPMIGKDVYYEWKNLHGEEFFEYLRKHPDVR